MSWQIRKGPQIQTESVTLFLPWEIPSSGVLLKMENAAWGWFSWMETRWLRQPWLIVYSVLITLSDQSRSIFSLSVLQSGLRWRIHRMKDDYSVLCCIYSCSFSSLRNLGPARKILPHRFKALWIISVAQVFLYFGNYFLFQVFSSVFLGKNTLSSDRGQWRSCKKSSWEEIDLNLKYILTTN